MQQLEVKHIIDLSKQYPALLLVKILEKQRDLELTPEETVLLQYIWLELAKDNRTPSNSYLAEISNLDVETVQGIVVNLMKKEVINIISQNDAGKIFEAFDVEYLIAKLYTPNAKPTVASNPMKQFVANVENEFSRKLSSIEIRLIESWVYDDKIDYEMLDEVLKETVLSGVKNFKYMDAILKNWLQNGKQMHIKQNNNSVHHAKNKTFTQEEKELASFDWISSLGEMDD